VVMGFVYVVVVNVLINVQYANLLLNVCIMWLKLIALNVIQRKNVLNMEDLKPVVDNVKKEVVNIVIIKILAKYVMLILCVNMEILDIDVIHVKKRNKKTLI